MDICSKKKDWKFKKLLSNDEFLTLLHPTDDWKSGKYRMALEKKRVNDEAAEVLREIVNAWKERLGINKRL